MIDCLFRYNQNGFDCLLMFLLLVRFNDLSFLEIKVVGKSISMKDRNVIRVVKFHVPFKFVDPFPHQIISFLQTRLSYTLYEEFFFFIYQPSFSGLVFEIMVITRM